MVAAGGRAGVKEIRRFARSFGSKSEKSAESVGSFQKLPSTCAQADRLIQERDKVREKFVPVLPGGEPTIASRELFINWPLEELPRNHSFRLLLPPVVTTVTGANGE